MPAQSTSDDARQLAVRLFGTPKCECGRCVDCLYTARASLAFPPKDYTQSVVRP